jgi:glycosyltransferase involved in cell wall biosynthesis
MNTFYERKGWDVLLRAWFEEFSRDDPVELCIKSYKENDRDCSIENVISVFAKQNGFDLNRKAPIKVIDEVISSDELPKFMKSYDAYVSPHRSEGFGMNIWYAMALGIPVICTDYGGCTDFARKDTAWLFKKEKMVKPSSNELKIFPHLGNIVWAEPDVADMRVQIRSCLSNKKEREKRSAAGVRFVQDKYSCENSILAFEDAVRKINPILIELLKED